jgi:hypothetical protein
MKKYLILFFLAIGWSKVFTQIQLITESAPLKELEDGWIKILQLKNGNTVFLHFTKSKGFKVILYNNKHQFLSENTIKPSFNGNSRMGMYGSVQSIISVKNDVVVFISTMKLINMFKGQPLLYRIIVDGSKGTLVKEEEVASMNTFGYKDEVATKNGYLEYPDFFIRKDENSDNYAIALFDTFESDRNKRLKFVHYSADHNMLSEAYFQSPNNEYKFLSFLDMLVMADSKLIVAVKCKDLAADKRPAVFFGTLKSSATLFEIKKVESASNGGANLAHLKYNRFNNTIMFLGLIAIGDYHYSYEVALIDPTTLEKTNTSKIERVDGCPKRFYLNNDSTYTLISQKITSFSQYSSTDRHHERTTYYIGTLTVRQLNAQGNEVKKYDVLQNFTLLQGGITNPIAFFVNPEGPEPIFMQNEFRTFTYSFHKNSPLLCVNELPRNINQTKTKEILGISAVNSYLVSPNENKPNFEPLFQNSSPKEYSFAMLGASSFDSSTNTITTVRRSNKKGWQNQVVWIKLKD